MRFKIFGINKCITFKLSEQERNEYHIILSFWKYHIWKLKVNIEWTIATEVFFIKICVHQANVHKINKHHAFERTFTLFIPWLVLVLALWDVRCQRHRELRTRKSKQATNSWAQRVGSNFSAGKSSRPAPLRLVNLKVSQMCLGEAATCPIHNWHSPAVAKSNKRAQRQLRWQHY